MSDGFGLISLLPTIIIGLAVGLPSALWLCPKMGARRWPWVLLSLIPFVGLMVPVLLVVRALGAILDKMNQQAVRRD